MTLASLCPVKAFSLGTIGEHRPVFLIAAVTSGFEAALDWGIRETQQAWGPLYCQSNLFDFSETDYYEKSMGKNLKKQFLVFDRLVDPACLPDFKILANQLEEDYRDRDGSDLERPINIDPGYITEAKLVLATTKDRDHRVFLDRGIYAEVTLHFHHGQWESRPWTYPDYQRVDFQEFFSSCRDELRRRYRQLNQPTLPGGDLP